MEIEQCYNAAYFKDINPGVAFTMMYEITNDPDIYVKVCDSDEYNAVDLSKNTIISGIKNDTIVRILNAKVVIE